MQYSRYGASMGRANRVQYSRWDGTQVGFDLDATDIFGEITDDLLYHGDINAALRRMMQEGFDSDNGERMKGLREMMDELRRKRRETLESNDLGGIYDEIVKATGKRTPKILGGTSAETVAAAIEKAIQTAPPEMILNFPAMRPVFLFRDFFPRLGEKLILATTLKFLKRAATHGK